MILKQFKLRLEFTLNVNELTDETVHEIKSDYSNYDELIKDPLTWKHAERQKRLLHALFANPDTLEKFTRKVTVNHLETYGYDEAQAKLDSDEDANGILLSVIEGLDREDSEYFTSAIEKRLFPESIAEFSECFTLELTDADYLEVPSKQ